MGAKLSLPGAVVLFFFNAKMLFNDINGMFGVALLLQGNLGPVRCFTDGTA